MGFWSKLFGKKSSTTDSQAAQSGEPTAEQSLVIGRRVFTQNDASFSNERIAFHEIEVSAAEKQVGETIKMTDPIDVNMLFTKHDGKSMFFPTIEVAQKDGEVVFVTSSAFTNMMMGAGKTGKMKAFCQLPANYFNAGEFTISIRMHSSDGGPEVIIIDKCLSFEVAEAKASGAIDYVSTGGATRPLLKWKIQSDTNIASGLIKKFITESAIDPDSIAEEQRVILFSEGTDSESGPEWKEEIKLRHFEHGEAANDRIAINEIGIHAAEKEFTEPIRMTDPIELVLDIEKIDTQGMFFPTIEVKNETGQVVFVTSSAFTNMMMGMGRTGLHHIRTQIDANYFNAGKYQLDLIVHSSGGGGEVIWLKNLLFFEIQAANKPGAIDYVETGGFVRPLLKWKFSSEV